MDVARALVVVIGRAQGGVTGTRAGGTQRTVGGRYEGTDNIATKRTDPGKP